MFKFLNALRHEDHRRALYATMIYAMICILFFFLVSMEEPDPPLVEKVIPIDMENIEIPEEILEQIEDMEGGSSGAEGHANPEEQVVNTPGEQIETQDNESVPVNGNPANNPRPDDGLSFGGNQGTGTGTGDDGFGSGDGVGDGVGDGDGKYNGSRKVAQAPVFDGSGPEEGIIALEIWVDENGTVTKTRFLESKSTSGNEYLIRLATKAAKTMKFERKPGAGIEKVPYQTFTFKKV
jgi:TonB family protein